MVYQEAAGAASAVVGGGNGGAVASISTLSTKITRTTFSGNLATDDTADFEAVTDMIAAPTNWTYATINFGGDSDGSAGSGLMAFVTKAEFDAWTAGAVAGSPVDANGVHFRDFPSNSPGSVNRLRS